ncbi:unnamed protein product [Calypogeia fissa]
MDILELRPLVSCVVLICAFFILGIVLILLNEFPRKDLKEEHREVEEFSAKVTEKPTVLRKETWQAWAGALHPGWLLGLRVFAFVYLLGLLITVRVQRQDWFHVFYYYTEWSLGLLIIYFGWGSFVSIVEYTDNLSKAEGINTDPENGDSQVGLLSENKIQDTKAGYFGYTLQFLFQTVAPAVALTDGVYWTFLFPFFPDDFPHTFSEFNLHALNAVFLVVELFLNSMRFPWFRAGYFFIWSCLYVFFQWAMHSFGLLEPHVWPYPFMDVSSPYAPIWYLVVGILHLAAYAIVAFLNRLKLWLQDRDAYMSTTARWWSFAVSLWPGGMS